MDRTELRIAIFNGEMVFNRLRDSGLSELNVCDKIFTARTLRVIDVTLTFYLEINEIPRLFSIPKFLRPNL